MNIPLIFHFNQHLHPFAQLAGLVGYRGLLRVLLDAPVKANIHISGTLVQSLLWFDPEPLELIRAGLESGQFELLGSTHTQNILVSGDDWDNRAQIRLHREILADTFGVAPDAFWNPERVWRQDLAALLVDEDYSLVPIEDHILERSGGAERVVYETGHEGRRIRVVRDDERFKHLFNFGAWFGRTAQLHAYLDEISEAEPEAVFAYGEDAEAMGLWGFSVQVHPQQTWDRLGVLLRELADRGDVALPLLGELPPPAAYIDQITEGSAAWMDASLANPDLPYHEDGYKNWFDFNRTSLKLIETRQVYARIREAIKASNTREPLGQLALHAYLTHQYEFGCIGIGGPGSRVWSGAGAAISLLRLAGAPEGVSIEDWNADGVEEILVRSGSQALVLTPTGGRVLYWADLESGRLLAGNPSSVSPGKFVNESTPPRAETPRPDLDFLRDGYAQLNAPAEPPTAMRRFLPDWVWDAGDRDLSLAQIGPPTRTGAGAALLAQQGAFLDEIRIRGENYRLDQVFRRDGLRFDIDLPGGLLLEKVFQWTGSGPAATYRISGEIEAAVELVTSFEISGDYGENLRRGRDALQAVEIDGVPAVRTAAGRTIRLHSDHPGAAFSHRPGFHAEILEHRVEFKQLPVEFTLTLTA